MYYHHCKGSNSGPNHTFVQIQKMSPSSRWTCLKISLENWKGVGLQTPSALRRYPHALKKLHKLPNTWALHAPLSETVLRAITPAASIWLNFWAIAPAASQRESDPFVNLFDHNPESDSQCHSLRKEIFVSNGDRPICFDLSRKVIEFIILSREIRVMKIRILCKSTISSSPYYKQNYMRKKVLRKKAPIK